MSKKRTVHRVSDSRKNRPFVKFNFWLMVIIFGLSFAVCFVLYMVAANLDDNFFDFESSQSQDSEILADNSADTDISENISDSAEIDSSINSVVNPVPESERADDAYFDNAWILADSTLLDIKFNTTIKNVIGSSQINAVNINETKLDSVYGNITAYQNLQIINPKTLYIMLGSDIGTSSVDDMINSYSNFIADIKSSLPDTKIYIMQIPPVYTDSETLTNETVNDYNSRLIKLADNYSVYCIDTNTILKNNTGTLSNEYYSSETNTLTSQAYSAVYEYILTHTAQ